MSRIDGSTPQSPAHPSAKASSPVHEAPGADARSNVLPFPRSPAAPAAKGGARDALTDRQQQVLAFISESCSTRGYPPTLREIGERLGIRSTNGVNDHLKALEKKGYLIRHDLKSRALRVVNFQPGASEGEDTAELEIPELPPAERVHRDGPTHVTLGQANDDHTVEVPVLGKVAAGQPILALEQREDTVKVDRFLLGNHREVFALRVQGDSMIEAGIFDGDYIFVKKQPTANNGDIVVAMINDEATCKYYHPEADRIVFKPANSRLRPIEVLRSDWRAVNLLGTVVGVYRKMS